MEVIKVQTREAEKCSIIARTHDTKYLVGNKLVKVEYACQGSRLLRKPVAIQKIVGNDLRSKVYVAEGLTVLHICESSSEKPFKRGKVLGWTYLRELRMMI